MSAARILEAATISGVLSAGFMPSRQSTNHCPLKKLLKSTTLLLALATLIALSSCSTKPKLINNFCTIFQPLPDEKKEISTYARKIIEKMEGTISVSSKQNIETEFYFIIPFSKQIIK